MGGTSTDVSLIDQQPSFTNEGQLAEFPLAIPMLDIHTIGAGGGSIARVDEAGRLNVGPESAGAVPGPACYGHGGQQATITDANVVLGRLPASRALSGGLSLNMAAAQQAMEKIAHALNSSTRDAAVGIVQLANAHMVQALRVISIQRGYDPAEFNLLPFGGAAGLHMCAVARELGIRSIVVPVNSGILSAQGMLNAPAGQRVTQSLCALWSELTEHSVGQLIEKLRLRAVRQLESLKLSCTRTSQWLDMRYRGQSSTISLLWCEDLLTQFQREHEKRFGYCLSVELIELVTLKVWAYHDRPALQLEGVNQGMPAQAVDYVCLYEEDTPVPLYLRGQLVAGQAVIGPCIILDDAGTHYVEKLWRGRITPEGHIHLQMQEDCP